jgi:carotenoid cleavage dioxygenase-like enzyme
MMPHLSTLRQPPERSVAADRPETMTSWLTGVCTPVTEEVDVADLPVEGALPRMLEGDYLRNGANPRYLPQGRYLYPFDGDGMVHRVRFEGGRVSYRNRFVRTPGLVAELSAGRTLWPGVIADTPAPGPALVGPALAHRAKDRPNMNVIHHAGRLLALGESTHPFLLTPELETIGRETFGGLLVNRMSSHPKIDPHTGELVLFGQRTEPPYLSWSILDRDGFVRRTATPIPGLPGPTVIHDVGLTKHYLVFIISPLQIDGDDAGGPGRRFRWEPAAGTLVGLVPRDGSTPLWSRCDAFWVWHIVNAYEADDGDVIVDYPRWEAPDASTDPTRSGVLARMRINPLTERVSEEILTPDGLELPRIDDRQLTGEHRVIGGTIRTGRERLPPGSGDRLGWFDCGTRSLVTWNAARLLVGEQCFVPGPASVDRKTGWWVALATDSVDRSSRLLVIPADNPGGGPIASVLLPKPVPAGMHGSWVSKASA